MLCYRERTRRGHRPFRVTGGGSCDNSLVTTTRAAYFDPERDLIVEALVNSRTDIEPLLAKTLAMRSGRGHPTLELSRPDGSSLSLATDSSRAFLNWTKSLGESFHSTGDGRSNSLVFDYFGPWSEVPGDHAVGLDGGIECLENFLEHGVPDSPQVSFQPD